MTNRRVALAGGTSKGVVLDLIRTEGPISRVQLAETTGLTQATMSTVVRQLLHEGLVVESGHGESTGGKRPIMLDVSPNSRYAVGIQLGREGATYVVIDLVGAVVGRTRTVGAGMLEPEQMVGRLADEVRRTVRGLGIDASSVVGIGIVAPGPLDLARGLILHSHHLLSWRDVPINSLLSEATRLPVILDNDATAAAIGDFWSGSVGAAAAHATVYMGTGIGAGIVINGTVFRGASSNAGELGQIVMSDADGHDTFLEDLANPGAVVRQAQRQGIDRELGLQGVDNEFEDFRRIALAAVRGNAQAEMLIDRSARYLAAGTLGLVNLFDLESVSLAGPAFAIAGGIYVKAVSEVLVADAYARAVHPVAVRLAADAADAAAVGGAALVLQAELSPRGAGTATTRT